ncbi:epoxide hydrolase 1 [bacterium]|nr:epoxide hydrolase 1 [bacterium]
MIREFEIFIPDEEIEILNQKIDLTRWPDEINDDRWRLGTKKSFLQDAVNTWRHDFSWRQHENKLNEAGSFKYKTQSGLELHYLHKTANSKNAIPLLLTHGWPGSVQEFLNMIPLLTQGREGIEFHVVCPAIPGYGFSDKPKQLGMNSKEVAKLENELMLSLGYSKYIAQGGDWGATITKWIAELFPDNCMAIHLNLVLAFPPADEDPMAGVTPEEVKGMENFQKYQETGFGYYAIQSTKPQTLGYGLNDSPVGLAAWIIEKFHGWAATKPNQLVVPLDQVLAIISLYWFTESITSSARLYYENGPVGFSFNKVAQPMAGAIFDHEIARPPRAHAEKIYNIVQWNQYSGGHFAALENPDILAGDIFGFVKKLDIL